MKAKDKSMILSACEHVGWTVPVELFKIKGLTWSEFALVFNVFKGISTDNCGVLEVYSEVVMEAITVMSPLSAGVYYCCNTDNYGAITIRMGTNYKDYQFAFTSDESNGFMLIEKDTPVKLSKQLQSKGGNDEFYTPGYVVEEIIPYIPMGAIVWCPFDTIESQFVKLIAKTHQVVYSHIDMGQDYYLCEPDKWDVMISNPPFTGKAKIFERALSFGKPFALLMTTQWLNDSAPSKLWGGSGRDLELMMFNKRIHYINGLTGEIQKKTTFGSAYYCSDLLPKQIMFKVL